MLRRWTAAALDALLGACVPLGSAECSHSLPYRVLVGSASALAIGVLLLPLVLFHLVDVLFLKPNTPLQVHSRVGPTSAPVAPDSVTVMTANLCLLSSFMARFNGLKDTAERAHKLATLLLEAPQHGDLSATACAQNLSPGLRDCDLLCLQEVFSNRACSILTERLQSKYPHIISHVRSPNRGDWAPLGSGLMVASKFPLLSVRFHAFKTAALPDALCCKGLLMIKTAALVQPGARRMWATSSTPTCRLPHGSTSAKHSWTRCSWS
eukprot:m.213779 g.213779  ORF g.213779 m.213779 type:complete len:266 (+) comp54043_c0_seq1:32-829(+)